MKLLLSTVKTECFDSKLALKNMYNVVGNAPLDVYLREFDLSDPDQRIYEELLGEKYNILYFHCDEVNEFKIAHICELIKKAVPSCIAVVGGKEVSFETREFMQAHPEIDYVFRGECEKVLFDFVRSIITYSFDFENIDGLAYRENDEILVNKIGEPIRYEDIPFTYDKFEVAEGENVYYESSRGVPDTCHYSQYMPGMSLRSLSLNRICNELRYFLVKKVGKVTFVEKWFNYDVARAYRIWEYLINNDNGITSFIFDINGDLLDEETVELLSEARPGLFHFDVDIETTNATALAAAGRKENIYQLMYNVTKLLQNSEVDVRVVQRVGLPGETIELFERAFNKMYNLHADTFDIEVLRIKRGTMFRQRAEQFGYEYSRECPNEVIASDYLSAASIVRIKLIANTVKTFEHGFEDSINKIMFDAGLRPFEFFDGLTSFIMRNDLSRKLGKEENMYRVLYTYAADLYDKNEDTLKLQVLQEVLHSDMNKNVSQDVIRKLERKGWEIHVTAKH